MSKQNKSKNFLLMALIGLVLCLIVQMLPSPVFGEMSVNSDSIRSSGSSPVGGKVVYAGLLNSIGSSINGFLNFVAGGVSTVINGQVQAMKETSNAFLSPFR